MRRLSALLAALVVAMAACGPAEPAPEQGRTSSAPTTAAPSAAPSLVAKAKLARCPDVRQAPPGTKGQALPVVTLPCLGAGPAVPVGGLRGPLVVNLWATWCEPCREEAPLFQRLHAATDEVAVLGIDHEDRSPDAALAFAADVGLRYPSLYDQQGRVLAAAKAGTGLPVTLFVDRAGTVVQRKIGPYTAYGQLTADVRTHLEVRP